MAKKKKEKKKSVKGNKRLTCALIFIILMITCICMCVLNTMTESYNIEVGDIADKTITAPYDFIDEYSTNIVKEEEMQKVPPVYNTDNDETNLSKKQVSDAFSAVENAREYAKQVYLSDQSSGNFEASSVNWKSVLNAEDLNAIHKILPDSLTDESISSMSQDRATALKDTTYEFVIEALEKGIVYEDLQSIYDNIKAQIIRTGVYTNAQAELAYDIISNTLTSNQVYDAEATELAKQSAAEAVKPISYKEGENIVQKGEKISQKQYEVIKQLGLSSDQNSMTSRWIVASTMFLMIFAIGYFYLWVNDDKYILVPKNAFNISLLILLTAILSMFARRFTPFILPLFIAVLLAATFMKKRMAIAFGCFLSIVSSFMISPSTMFLFNDTVMANMLAGISGSTVCIMTLKKKQHRGEYILSGFFAGLAASVVYVAYGVISDYKILEIIKLVGIAAGSGLICGLVSVGVLPIWEMMFSLATPSKLLELANPGSELLKRMMIEAPGTYHHSAVTANLSEAGCEAIGANSLLARVAAYYHDIGKLYNPIMFKENQLDSCNPHDELSPKESAEILKNHVIYGGKLADKYKLPEKIKDIILQHHGNSTMAFFLYKAKQEGTEVNEADFRYPGPRPQTVEAGVVMLADVVEAAVRANQATLKKGDYGDFIRKMIKAKYDDGQLDMCPMNRRDLELVLKAFENVYEGANHERIIYPEDEE